VAFFASAVMLTIYVVVHYILRKEEGSDDKSEATIRLVSNRKSCEFVGCFIS
jgi:hypothetical protein